MTTAAAATPEPSSPRQAYNTAINKIPANSKLNHALFDDTAGKHNYKQWKEMQRCDQSLPDTFGNHDIWYVLQAAQVAHGVRC